MPTRYYISLPDHARGDDARLSFQAGGPEGMAGELQDALRSDALFERWRSLQDEPADVDPALGATDPNTQVTGSQDDLHVALVVTTSLPSAVMRQRLDLLAGSNWQLRDVTAA